VEQLPAKDHQPSSGKRFWWRLFRFCGFLFLGSLALLLLLPLWLPWALKPAAGKYGLHYRDYERKGYGRFALSSLTYSNSSLTWTARTARIAVPTAWLWNRWLAGTLNRVIEVADWRLELRSAESHRTNNAAAEGSTLRDAESTARIFEKWNPWARNVSLENGIVQANRHRIEIEKLFWNEEEVAGNFHAATLGLNIDLAARLHKGRLLTLSAREDSTKLRLESRTVLGASNLVVEATLSLLTNQLHAGLIFDRNQRLPEQMTLNASSFEIPAALFAVREFESISGSVGLLWQTNGYRLTLALKEKPAVLQSNVPPLDIAIQASGDLERVRVDHATIIGPGLSAYLQEPLQIPFAQTSAPVRLVAVGDLARQSWIDATGAVSGSIVFTPSFKKWPKLELDLMGRSLHFGDVDFASGRLRGVLDWPLLQVSDLRITIRGTNEAVAAADLDLANQRITNGQFHYSGPLPVRSAKWSLEKFSTDAQFGGPVATLAYSANVSVAGLKTGDQPTIDVESSVTGEGAHLRATGKVQRASALIRFAGEANVGTNRTEIGLQRLELSRGGVSQMALEKAVSAEFRRTTNGWSVASLPMTLSGPAGSASVDAGVDWPEAARVAVRVRNFSCERFGDLLPAKVRPATISELSLDAIWTNGPIAFSLSAIGSYRAETPFSVRGDIRGDATGVLISNLTMTGESAPVISGSGLLPLTFVPGAPDWVQFAEDQPFHFRARTWPDPQFWERVRQLTAIRVRQPEFLADIGGTWHSPTGMLHASASSIQLLSTSNAPPVEHLRLQVEFRDRLVVLPRSSFDLAGQPVIVEGELPMEDKVLHSIIKGEVPDLARASAHLAIARAPASAFMRYLPNILQPLGTVQLEATLRPGAKISGTLSVDQLTTVPLGSLGVIRDITGNVRVEESTLRLDGLQGTMGGEPLKIVGTAQLPTLSDGLSRVPPFQFRLTGENVSLARQPQTIIRGNLDLLFAHTNSSQPLISGSIQLRDSIYTSDLESLIPGRVSKPAQRPPYFSIESEPLADWRLDCRVKGQEFLKMRTPFFRGTLSTDFKLEGTLKEPLASGEATVPKGQVEFPFGTLEIKSAIVSVTAADPFQPRLYVIARARRLGYEITMQVTGNANNPVIQFSSVPSLSSDQILLLLSAGEIPREDITMTPQQKAQRFALFFGQRVLSKLGFGGDSERLSVRSGEDVSETGRQTYDVEYKLDQNWSLVGQYDRFNAFNLSVKRRIYSR